MKKHKIVGFLIAASLLNSVAFAERSSTVTFDKFTTTGMLTCYSSNIDNANKKNAKVNMDTDDLDANGFCLGQPNACGKKGGHLQNFPLTTLESHCFQIQKSWGSTGSMTVTLQQPSTGDITCNEVKSCPADKKIYGNGKFL